ncbi:hypothetical protein [Nostoc sp. MG11]|uniref:hypothetical protein n=1 Tax=Nostoc sp. MG11 TaxID=2721166 RepID=UPI00186659CB|nr:hypothetical protein [Nostoc sp. MG11]
MPHSETAASSRATPPFPHLAYKQASRIVVPTISDRTLHIGSVSINSSQFRFALILIVAVNYCVCQLEVA